MEYLATGIVGLVIGLAVGWFGHWLSVRRSENERAVGDATELWDRCTDVASERVRYVLAFHRKAPNVAEIKDEYLRMKRRYRWADPEVVLLGVPEWEAYHTAERAALADRSNLTPEHIKRIEATSY